MTIRTEKYLPNGTVVVTEEDDPRTMEDMRDRREITFKLTDLFMFSDRYDLLSQVEQTELLTYRQSLRDMTAGTIDEALQIILNRPNWIN